MPIITLTSDWGAKDHYIGAVKGTIISQMPEATIIDISHDIAPFNIKEAAFIVRNSYKYFPEGTVHIIGVNTEESDKHSHIALKINGQYFVGCDNGLFTLIFDTSPDIIVELNIVHDSDYFTFSSRDRFVKVAVHLAMGKNIEELGTIRDSLTEMLLFRPVIEQDVIKGMVIYIDNYENVITNITRPLFEKVRNGRSFKIVFRGEELKRIFESYSEVPEGEVVALFGSNDHLEIVINNGNASGLLGLNIDDPVRMEFG